MTYESIHWYWYIVDRKWFTVAIYHHNHGMQNIPLSWTSKKWQLSGYQLFEPRLLCINTGNDIQKNQSLLVLQRWNIVLSSEFIFNLLLMEGTGYQHAWREFGLQPQTHKLSCTHSLFSMCIKQGSLTPRTQQRIIALLPPFRWNTIMNFL